MEFGFPDYLNIPPESLGEGTAVRVRQTGGMTELAEEMAGAMLAEIEAAAREDRAATLIVPVGPVDQFPVLARLINERQVDCRDVVIINMDEYLTEEQQWVPLDHPLSFRGFMNRKFYDLIDPNLAPRPAHRVFPDPSDVQAIGRLIEERGGVDACFGGIGINGHVAFNEPPEPGEEISNEAFSSLATRCLPLSRETRTINAVTVGGEISIVPAHAVTVGMKEILASRKIRLYCNRPWQSAVVRRVLHGPMSAACPTSLLRSHPDIKLTLAEFVAHPPQIQLR